MIGKNLKNLSISAGKNILEVVQDLIEEVKNTIKNTQVHQVLVQDLDLVTANIDLKNIKATNTEVKKEDIHHLPLHHLQVLL